jgi:hypothetical protein
VHTYVISDSVVIVFKACAAKVNLKSTQKLVFSVKVSLNYFQSTSIQVHYGLTWRVYLRFESGPNQLSVSTATGDRVCMQTIIFQIHQEG